MTSTPRATPFLISGALLLTIGIAIWRFAQPVDDRLIQALRLDSANAALPFIRFLSDIGSFAILGPLALVVVALLAVKGRRADALWLFATIAATRLLVEGSKALIARPRPALDERLVDVTSLSFPSSHSAGTAITWLALAMLLPTRRAPAIGFAIAMALLVGWTRMALGVHWPSDVIAGYGTALLCLGVALRWKASSTGAA